MTQNSCVVSDSKNQDRPVKPRSQSQGTGLGSLVQLQSSHNEFASRRLNSFSRGKQTLDKRQQSISQKKSPSISLHTTAQNSMQQKPQQNRQQQQQQQQYSKPELKNYKLIKQWIQNGFLFGASSSDNRKDPVSYTLGSSIKSSVARSKERQTTCTPPRGRDKSREGYKKGLVDKNKNNITKSRDAESIIRILKNADEKLHLEMMKKKALEAKKVTNVERRCKRDQMKTKDKERTAMMKVNDKKQDSVEKRRHQVSVTKKNLQERLLDR